MPLSFAFVTLLTSDSYLPGALTAINSLLDIEGPHPAIPFDTVCLVTPSTVGHDSIQALHKTFDKVVGVEEIETKSWQELSLLGRKDLAASLTKLHIFRLTQYKKIIFLDADTLVLRRLSPLFELAEEFSAAPDSGWPDAFNSGFMVATPSESTFGSLMEMMAQKGTWDGGDQGLLNDFFPNWNRLSFTYNVTPSAYYTYAPAYRRHGSDVSVLHFIGRQKPWHRGTRETFVPDAAQTDYYGLVNQWFDVYERHFGLAQTYDVASRVVNPPASFKSTYADLPAMTQRATPPPLSLPAPIGIPGSSSAISIPGGSSTVHPIWDPARSSPPRNSTHLQMNVPVTTHYENIWDDPSKKNQQVRFQAPKAYPSVPKETHEWYKEVMGKAPDPSAVKPVFPWEERRAAATSIPSRSFPEDEPPRPLPILGATPTPPAPVVYAPGTSHQTSFTNAWDNIPAIGRYVQSLAKVTAPAPRSSSVVPSGDSGLGGRKSSLQEPRSYDRRSDASSRDGDDEDEEETNSSEDEQRDRYKIIFKHRSGSSDSGSQSPSDSRIAAGADGTHYPPPHSPTKSRPRHNGPSGEGGSTTSPRLRSSPSIATPSSGHHLSNATRLSPTSPVISLPSTSPRLAAQAIRNSTAARLSSSGTGTGDGPPVVRATRVFSPDTDTGVVKKQGLAALQRFVENMEAEAGNGGNGSGNGHGAGSGANLGAPQRVAGGGPPMSTSYKF